jgi:hypothetical protein
MNPSREVKTGTFVSICERDRERREGSGFFFFLSSFVFTCLVPEAFVSQGQDWWEQLVPHWFLLEWG